MIVRKLSEVCRTIYEIFVLPFIRIYYEIRTKSVIKQKTFLFGKNVFGGRNFVGMNSYLHNVSLGFGSYVSRNCYFVNSRIGKYCSIGDDVKVVVGRHPISENVSTSPFFYSVNTNNGFSFVNVREEFEECKYINKDNKIYVEIGNDVWIGSNVRILDGVRIGDGAVVGTNSLVTKDVEPYSVVAGAPIKVLRYRFEREQIEKLCGLKWWNKDIKWLKKHAREFQNIEELLEKE